MRNFVLLLASAAAVLMNGETALAAESAMARIRHHDSGIIVVAHRGCHAPAPKEGLSEAPENSLTALEHCIKLGVDVVEIDVRRTRDGHLVIIHDDSVDRTTDGQGRVSGLTLSEIRRLKLRQGLGGNGAALTDEVVPTLDEILARAKGRVLLNLDVKDSIYAEVIDAVVRAGVAEGVIIKTVAGAVTPQLSIMPPYNRIPFIVIPISDTGTGSDIPKLIESQSRLAPKPIAVELPHVDKDNLSAISKVAISRNIRLWVNTLSEGFVRGGYSDLNALRDPDSVWGKLYRSGVTIIQTDEPAALANYRKSISDVKATR